MWAVCKYYTIYMGLEHLPILASEGHSGTNPPLETEG